VNWERKKFENLYLIPSKNGLTKPSRIRGEGYKFINMGELFAYDRIRNPIMELVPLSEKEKVSHKIEENDLLFARQSIVLSGAGKCSIVKEVDALTVFDSHIIRVRLNKEKCNPDFYYYYFKTPDCNIKSLVQQGVQAGIRAKELAKLEIDHPPLKTQKRIAHILSDYDNLIENNIKRISLLEQAAQNIYMEWFVIMRFPGHEDSIMGLNEAIPSGWAIKRLYDVFSVKYGKNLPKTQIKDLGEYPVYGASGIIGYYELANTVLKAALITSRGNGSGDVHRTYHSKAYVTNNSFVVTPKEEYSFIPLSYTTEVLKTLNLKNYCSGSAQPQLTNAAMKNITFVFPEPTLIKAFSEVVTPILSQCDLLRTQNRKLKGARDILLPRLMNQTIKV
jgi:type I restriction enzyme, S subunit